MFDPLKEPLFKKLKRLEPHLESNKRQNHGTQKLVDILQKVNEEYFQFSELPYILWSKGRIQKRYKRLTLGTYDLKKNHIRIHPIFREKDIPNYVLEFVIYHELLHHEDRHILKKRKRFMGRRQIHTKTFHKREKAFPLKKEAHSFVKQLMKG